MTGRCAIARSPHEFGSALRADTGVLGKQLRLDSRPRRSSACATRTVFPGPCGIFLEHCGEPSTQRAEVRDARPMTEMIGRLEPMRPGSARSDVTPSYTHNDEFKTPTILDRYR